MGGRRVLLQDGAGVVTCDGVGDVLERRDDGAGAAPRHEAQRGLDLGAHRAAAELAGRGVLAQLAGGDPAQRPGAGPAVPDQHLRDVGRDHERAGVQLARQQRCGEVLVDDGLDAVQRSIGAVVDHRDAAPAGADDDEPRREQRLDGRHVEHPPRFG